MKRANIIMNKNKLTITIICFVLIGFIAAASIGQRNKQVRTQYVTIIRSEEELTTVSATERTTVSITKKKTAVRMTTAAESVTAAETTASSSEPLYININTADYDELIRLPHIGDVLAQNIIAYRENHGNFRNIEEIMLVSGIGDVIFAAICGSIYVDDPVYEEEIISEPEEITEIPYELEEETTEQVSEEFSETVGLTLEDVIPIDLNTADAETLMLLPYVSEEAAVKIIELRDSIGRFSHPYEIYYAEVLEPSQIEEICEYVTVSRNDSVQD